MAGDEERLEVYRAVAQLVKDRVGKERVRMIVHKVEVLRYKCLRYVSQELRQFQILVGPNASGKSTFLDVLVFLQDILRDGVQEAVRKRARSVRELTWRMEQGGFEFAIELNIPETIRKQLKGEYSRARYEVQVGTDESGTLTLPVENLWLVKKEANALDLRPKEQPKLFPEEPSPPPSIVIRPRKHSPPGYRKVMSRTADGRLYIRSETTDWNLSLSIGYNRAGLTMIPEEEERFPVSAWVRRTLMEGIQFLQLNCTVMRWPCRPDAPRTFQPDGSNLPLVVEGLQRDYSRQLKRWIQHLGSVLPEIKQVTVKERQEDRFRYLVVEVEDGKVFPSWLLSDGTLRLFALTLLSFLPEEKGIFMVEEPENGIHPRALEAVYQSLSSVYEGQVLCATHSPIFLNLAKPEELLCFALTESGATSLVSGDRHPRLREWREKVLLGDLLASGILG
jgi:predicted ATPase